uniref:Helicase POLQ-like n=1 Tax=Panagrellus redivivus TaxID=6233 RepID=A0A7E4VJA7_PANRE
MTGWTPPNRKRILCERTETSVDSGIGVTGEDEEIPTKMQKKYMGSPTSIYFNSENTSGLEGLSRTLLDKYKAVRKITELYPWQQEFLNNKELLNGENFLLTAQTGGGKTLIAEILMLREIFNRNCSAIFVLPLVALVQEKILAFKALADAFNVRIEEYAAHKGRIPPIKRQDHRSLFVCTIEKASLLINSLMEQKQLKTVGLLVLDEVHMIGESGRGANLECLIAKYAHAHPRGQIVAMSATIGNSDELAKFLKGYHYHNSSRPVELKQYIAADRQVIRVTEQAILEPERNLVTRDPADPDGVVELALEIIPKHSVLIFCNSRAACENLCTLLFSRMPKAMIEHRRDDRVRIVEELKAETDNQAAQGLKNALRVGIAYHHAGLMSCERQVVEAAFHSGAISIVCATSTLAAGVNMPARRVIIRSPKVGIQLMTKSQFLQMAGRAGRAGFDDVGECIVVANEARNSVLKIIIEDPIPSCQSQLAEQLEAFILDLVGLGFTNKENLVNIVKSTLLGVQNPESITESVEASLAALVESRFLLIPTEGEYGLSLYGRGKFHSGLSPKEIPEIVDHFKDHFGRGLAFKTRFSIISICVPFDVRVAIDWDVFREQYLKLETCDRRMFGEHNVVEAQILKRQRDGGSPTMAEMRLYTAMVVHRLCKYGMTSLYDNARVFKVAVGWIQQTYESMCHRAQALGRFSEHVSDMWPLRGLLPELVNYMRSAGNEEIAQLMSVDGITRTMAGILVKSKYNTVGAISRASIEELREVLNGKLRKNLAEKIIFSAKCVLRDAIDEKKEEIAALGGGLGI